MAVEQSPLLQRLLQDRILRNISWLSLSYLVAKPLWFAFITAGCMRVLSPYGYGIFTTSLVLAMMASAISDLGTTDFTTRAVSRSREAASELLTNLLLARIGLSIAGVMVALVAAGLLGYEPSHVLAVLAAGLYAVAFRGAEYCRAFYRAFEELRHEAVLTVIEKVMVVAAGMAALAYFREPAHTFAGMAGAMVLVLAVNVWWVDRRFAPLNLSLARLGFMWRALRNAAPLGLVALLTLIPLAMGPLLVEALISTEAAGWFGAAQRVVEALLIAASVVVLATFPRMSALFATAEREALARLLKRVIVGIFLVASAVAAVLTAAAPSVIRILSGDGAYDEAGSLLVLFVWTFPVASTTYISTMALIAMDAHRLAAIAYGAAAIASVILSMALIPWLDMVGPVVALIVVFTLLTLANLRICSERLRALESEPTDGRSPASTIVGG